MNDVEECLEIIEESQNSIMTDTSTRRPKQDIISNIFEIIKGSLNYKDNREEDYDELEKKIVARGYKGEDLRKTIDQYQRVNVLFVDSNNSVRMVAE